MADMEKIAEIVCRKCVGCYGCCDPDCRVHEGIIELFALIAADRAESRRAIMEILKQAATELTYLKEGFEWASKSDDVLSAIEQVLKEVQHD